MIHLYSTLLSIVVHPKRFTVIWGGSPQPPPVCSIHLDDATAATGQRRQCAHHTPATGGELHDSEAHPDENVVHCGPNLWKTSRTDFSVNCL